MATLQSTQADGNYLSIKEYGCEQLAVQYWSRKITFGSTPVKSQMRIHFTDYPTTIGSCLFMYVA